MSAVGRKFSDDLLFADPIPDCPALTAGETVNGWRVVEPVGNGGFGKVFRAVKKGVVGALRYTPLPPEAAHVTSSGVSSRKSRSSTPRKAFLRQVCMGKGGIPAYGIS